MNYHKNLILDAESAIAVLTGTGNWLQGVGNALPAVLIIASLFSSEAATPLIIIAAPCAVVMGWYLKFSIVTRAAQVQGYALGIPQRATTA